MSVNDDLSNRNLAFKFCPFCPEPLDDDRQLLIHVIVDHTSEYSQVRNQESLTQIFRKLPAIRGSIIEKRIVAKRRNLDQDDDEILRKIVLSSSSPMTNNIPDNSKSLPPSPRSLSDDDRCSAVDPTECGNPETSKLVPMNHQSASQIVAGDVVTSPSINGDSADDSDLSPEHL